MSDLPLKGALTDESLPIVKNGGIVIAGDRIVAVGDYKDILDQYPKATQVKLEKDHVAMPGMIDAHTHICYAGSRARDYAMRNAGRSYLDIGKAGGGIWDTVIKTRAASEEMLTQSVITRATKVFLQGVTTIEVKSGYGLSVTEELKMLRAISGANQSLDIDIISTCLAAHIVPKDDGVEPKDYLRRVVEEVFSAMKTESLSHRVDAFVEEGAYDATILQPYLKAALEHGFDITIHADQFHKGGVEVAVGCGAISADHLEASGDAEITLLAESDVIAMALPGASIGLGMGFTPARRLLDAGAALAIASDWNPGSAPLGDLLTCAAILGTFEKLSATEVLAGITYRAAAALGLKDRGVLAPHKNADFIAFPTGDYRDILYHQGQLKPSVIWKNGMSHSNY